MNEDTLKIYKENHKYKGEIILKFCGSNKEKQNELIELARKKIDKNEIRAYTISYDLAVRENRFDLEIKDKIASLVTDLVLTYGYDEEQIEKFVKEIPDMVKEAIEQDIRENQADMEREDEAISHYEEEQERKKQ